MKKNFINAKIRYHLTPGKALKSLRELQGLTQEQLSRMTGIAQSHISAMEREITNIGCDRALALAKALRVHPAVILFPDFDINDLHEAA